MEKKISGWANNKPINCKVYFPKNILELKKVIKKKTIARGLGRSYGDSSIQPNSTIITTNLNKILNFDTKKGIIEAEAGISIKEIIKKTVKKGWFLPVTPGSKNITLGGMVASDVHGKNHHKVGSFKNHIIQFKLINRNKRTIICSKKKNQNLFNFTVGGMGLTGIICSCKFKLKKIKTDLIYQEKIRNKNLHETIKSIKNSNNWEYNVAWIDTSANYKNLGRSILIRGNHVKKIDKNLVSKELYENNFSIPNIFPNWFMNKFFIKILNSLYYYLTNLKKRYLHLNNFFYPLDGINNWNLFYGKNGFISYQCLLPRKNANITLKKILIKMKENKLYSFVSVLKSMGKKDGSLSFGSPGFTMVFDFPLYNNIYKILDELDEIILNNNGKIYLTKDSRISSQKFKNINKEFNSKAFKKIRKKDSVFFSSLQSERLNT